jgi:hypothetical protein
MRRPRLILSAAVLLAVAPAAAFADATLFFGTSPTPSNRALKGVALGTSVAIVGLEFEYAAMSEDVAEGAPGLTTGMGNVFLQTPVPIGGFQPYVTGGVGVYSERFDDHQETHVGVNTGGGLKVSIAGPLRIRIDYRVLRLAGRPLHGTAQRIYAGLHVAF